MDNDQVNPNGNQDQNLGWRAALPSEWKEHDFVKAYQKPGDFVKSAYEIAQDRDALKTRVENSIPKITDKSTDAEKAAYYAAIGRPEKPDGYEFKVSEGVPIQEADVKWFQQAAHKLGIPKQQAELFFNDYAEKLKSDLKLIDKNIEQRQTESVNKLKTEWGGNYQANFDLAKKTAQKIGGDEVMKHLNETGIGNDPVMVQFFFKLGGMLSESAFIKGSPTAPTDVKRTEGGMPILNFPSMDK